MSKRSIIISLISLLLLFLLLGIGYAAYKKVTTPQPTNDKPFYLVCNIPDSEFTLYFYMDESLSYIRDRYDTNAEITKWETERIEFKTTTPLVGDLVVKGDYILHRISGELDTLQWAENTKTDEIVGKVEKRTGTCEKLYAPKI